MTEVTCPPDSLHDRFLLSTGQGRQTDVLR